MKRSQSAPQPLPALVKKPSLPRSSSHVHLQQHVKREIRMQTSVSPSVEREDPFSLGGFFPSSKNSESEEWTWLREESKAEGKESIALDDSVNLSDEELQALIEREDKMGVLTLSLGALGLLVDVEAYSTQGNTSGCLLCRITSHAWNIGGPDTPTIEIWPEIVRRMQKTLKGCRAMIDRRPIGIEINDGWNLEIRWPRCEIMGDNFYLNHQLMPHDNVIHHSREQTPTQSTLISNNPPSPSPSSSNHAKPSVTPPASNVTENGTSLQSLLTASSKDTTPNGQIPNWNASLPITPQQHENGVQLVSQSSTKRKHEDQGESDDPHNKIRRIVRDHVSHDPARVMPMTTVICLHAAVAQKSYGSEKRFLCPPPVVHIEGPVWQMRNQQLSMTVVGENGERANEQKAPLDSNMTASFKFLHVTGTAKAKNFQLSLDIAEPSPHSTEGPDVSPGRVWASFDSALVTIISKPSKKSAKTRNISSCILAGGPVSLFNRINSQTVRTKYMTIDHGQFCASNVAWSAFNVTVVRRPNDTPHPAGPQPVTYGSEIVLSDTNSGISTAPLVIRKVDKGRVSADDGGPVSQMQKIALQRINPDGSRHYLSAQGPSNTPGVVAPPAPGMSSQAGTHPLLFQSPRVRDELKDGVRIISDEVDDYLCWTIVGISKFQYTFFDAFGQNNSIPEAPITPFPTLFTTPVYRQSNNVIELTVSNFFYEDPKTRIQVPLDVYLGNLGPLRHRVYQASPPFVQPSLTGITDPGHPDSPSSPMLPPGLPRYVPPGPLHTIVIVEMPALVDVIKALEEDALPSSAEQSGSSASDGPDGRNDIPPPSIGGRSLPLLFIRASDGVGYHSGRTITCESVFSGMDVGGNPSDPNWLAAAQAVDGAPALHSWTLRVM